MLGPSRRRICLDFVTTSNKQQKSKKDEWPIPRSKTLFYVIIILIYGLGFVNFIIIIKFLISNMGYILLFLLFNILCHDVC